MAWRPGSLSGETETSSAHVVENWLALGGETENVEEEEISRQKATAKIAAEEAEILRNLAGVAAVAYRWLWLCA